MRDQQLFGSFEHGNGLFTADAGEMIKQRIKRVAGGALLPQRLPRDTGANKHRRSAEDIGIAMDEGWECRHMETSGYGPLAAEMPRLGR